MKVCLRLCSQIQHTVVDFQYVTRFFNGILAVKSNIGAFMQSYTPHTLTHALTHTNMEAFLSEIPSYMQNKDTSP